MSYNRLRRLRLTTTDIVQLLLPVRLRIGLCGRLLLELGRGLQLPRFDPPRGHVHRLRVGLHLDYALCPLQVRPGSRKLGKRASGRFSLSCGSQYKLLQFNSSLKRYGSQLLAMASVDAIALGGILHGYDLAHGANRSVRVKPRQTKRAGANPRRGKGHCGGSGGKGKAVGDRPTAVGYGVGWT